MRLNSKLTWGLAWAGLAVVIAVPSADLLTGKKTAALLTSTTDPVKTAAVTTTVTPNGIKITPAGSATGSTSGDPVNTYLKTNKALPDYLTGGNSAASSEPPTQVAAIDPTPPVIAPVPFPARPPDAIAPSTTKTFAPAPTQTAAIEPRGTESQPSTPYVIDEPAPGTQQATLDQPAGPIPPAPILDDSAQWHTKSLEKYLDQNGLIDNSPARSTAQMTVVNQSNSNYDPNGFYLSEGPNNQRAARRARMLELLNEDESDGDSSGGFSLF